MLFDIPVIMFELVKNKKAMTEFAENSLVSIFPIIHRNWNLKAAYLIHSSSKKCFNSEYTALPLSLSNTPPKNLCHHL